MPDIRRIRQRAKNANFGEPWPGGRALPALAGLMLAVAKAAVELHRARQAHDVDDRDH